ncbi:hypothetical protein BPAE_0194g00140 [Botrytis paeoniae]|uniref:Cytochrome P450 n=1 Tax=Botrytis paeoniae TaxID=278948 RepID=A0A4Z1FF18_9HELO|nr:hypothetical protein BPAE_0194g00140 [Botrytis paeoniae]
MTVVYFLSSVFGFHIEAGFARQASSSTLISTSYLDYPPCRSQTLYNTYFHPLASYSGPLYLIASNTPLAVLSLLGTSQYRLKAAHDKYGDIVRIAPGTLSYIKPQAWSNIYGYKPIGGGVGNFPNDPRFYNEMMLGKQTITLASDEEAIPIRRSLNSAFSHRSLLEQEPMMQQHIGRLMEQFEKQSTHNHSVDVRKWFTFSVFDINSDFGFGEDMGCVENGVYHDWVKFVMDYFYAATLLHQCYKFWPLTRLLALHIPESTRKMQVNHNYASLKRVRKRMGTDIRRSFASIEDIKLQDALSKLPYLKVVVQETLRIHAPLANGFTRWVPDKNGAIICGQHVPQGTVVAINHYCSNTSVSNFRDPMSFIPERWMGDAAYTNDKREVVQPFSVGPRNCPGQQ